MSVTTYEDTVRRLSRQSVTKHFDAYADVDWDAPDMAVDADDLRFELPAVDPLGATDWYRSQPAATRSFRPSGRRSVAGLVFCYFSIGRAMPVPWSVVTAARCPAVLPVVSR